MPDSNSSLAYPGKVTWRICVTAATAADPLAYLCPGAETSTEAGAHAWIRRNLPTVTADITDRDPVTVTATLRCGSYVTTPGTASTTWLPHPGTEQHATLDSDGSVQLHPAAAGTQAS